MSWYERQSDLTPNVQIILNAVADPGFPVGGGGGGRRPLPWVLFGKNVCENQRIGSRFGGGHWRPPPDLPMRCHFENMKITKLLCYQRNRIISIIERSWQFDLTS